MEKKFGIFGFENIWKDMNKYIKVNSNPKIKEIVYVKIDEFKTLTA